MLPPEPPVVRQVRDALKEFIASWLSADAAEVVVLLASELATNAVVHARTAFSVSAELNPSAIRIVVSDGNPDQLPVLAPSFGPAGGFGLRLVDRFATRWAVELTDGGKSVWFELVVPADEQTLN